MATVYFIRTEGIAGRELRDSLVIRRGKMLGSHRRGQLIEDADVSGLALGSRSAIARMYRISPGSLKARFRREAEAAAALNHPNICTVHEIAEANGKTFIAMALIDCEPLEKRIEAGPLKLKDTLST